MFDVTGKVVIVTGGNKGIGAGLEVIQKVRDGERLSGGYSMDGFEVLSDDDDSFLD